MFLCSLCRLYQKSSFVFLPLIIRPGCPSPSLPWLPEATIIHSTCDPCSMIAFQLRRVGGFMALQVWLSNQNPPVFTRHALPGCQQLVHRLKQLDVQLVTGTPPLRPRERVRSLALPQEQPIGAWPQVSPSLQGANLHAKLPEGPIRLQVLGRSRKTHDI